MKISQSFALLALCAALCAGAFISSTKADLPDISRLSVIQGRVTDTDGSKAVGAKIWIVGVSRSDSSSSLFEKTAVTDQSGEFRIELGKDIQQKITAAQYPEIAFFAKSKLGAFAGEIFKKDIGRISLVLQKPQIVAATVVDENGKPVVGESFSIKSFTHYYTLAGGTMSSAIVFPPYIGYSKYISDQDGRIQFFIPRGVDSASISLNNPSRAIESRSQISMYTGASKNITISVGPAGTISGQVYAMPDKKPVKDAGITAYCQETWNFFKATSDENGRYLLKGVPKGTYRITCWSSGSTKDLVAPNLQNIKLDRAQKLDGQDIVFDQGSLISGTVTDKNGAPVPDTYISIQGSIGNIGAQTDKNGKYSIRAPAGKITIQPYKSQLNNSIMAKTIDTVNGENKTADFKFGGVYSAKNDSDKLIPPASPTIHGVVLGPNNKPVGAAEITAIASQRNMGINMMTAFSDFAGEFEIDDAAPGTVINAKFGDLVSGEGVKATSADKPLTIRLIRNAWASLVGQVNDSNGQPVPNADITVFRQIGNMGNSIASAKTNASGKYRIDNLYPGFAYSVSASHDKLASDSTGDSPVAKPHESISMPSIVMQKLDSFVAGVVLDPNGAPAVGYTVSYQEANPQPKCITDSNGKFRLDGLPSGHVELLILSATGTGTGFYETSGKTDIKIHFPDIDADNHTQPLYNPKLTVGAAPIDFTATDMNGDAIALSGLKGKVVVLDFWATWCNWSVHELPDIIDLDKQYRQKGVEVIGISLDRDKTDLQKMIDQKGISYPQVFDENGWSGAIPNLYKITAIPFNIVIGKDGLIAGVNLRRADLNQAVLKALGDK